MLLPSHVFYQLEFRVHIVLHCIIIPIHVVGCDIEQNAYRWLKRFSAIQLKAADLYDIPVKIMPGNLPGHAEANVAGEPHVESGLLHQMVCKQGGGRLSVRACDGDDLSPCMSES